MFDGLLSNKNVYSDSVDHITPDVLQDLIETHYYTDVGRFQKFYDLYKGRHRIHGRKPTDVNKPNNKISNDFFGQIIDDTVGYFLGKPIVFNLDDDKAQNELDTIFDFNNIDDMLMEVGKEMMIKGRSGVLVYQDENSNTRMVRIPAEECLFVYDTSKTDELLYAIRVYDLKVVDTSSPTNTRIRRYAEVYTKADVTFFYETDSGIYALDEEKELNPMPHIFGEVPLVPFLNNEEEQSDLAKIENLVDDYDKILSDASNEHEAYRNAYLMLKNMVASQDAIAKLKEDGIIEVMDDGDVKFVTKDVQADALNSHLDRLAANIHKFSHVPDMSDENFAGNLSGVAIKFKLFGLENKCIIKERKMTKALKKLLMLLSVPIYVSTGVKVVPKNTQIQFTRNIPNNLVEIADVVSKLNGVVDKETLLSLLPFVDDPKDILEKLQEEQDAYQKDLASRGGDFNSVTPGGKGAVDQMAQSMKDLMTE